MGDQIQMIITYWLFTMLYLFGGVLFVAVVGVADKMRGLLDYQAQTWQIATCVIFWPILSLWLPVLLADGLYKRLNHSALINQTNGDNLSHDPVDSKEQINPPAKTGE
jgi:hypothetical protein